MMKHNFSTLIILILQGLLIPTKSVLSIPGIITNSDGRIFEGELKALTSDTIRLDVQAGDGSVSYLFRKESIAGIEFLDLEVMEDGIDAYLQNQYEEAVAQLEMIHRNRSPFFKIFPDPQLAEPSLALGKAYLEISRYADATGVAGVLLGNQFDDPQLQTEANEILLRAFFGLRRWDETEVLAKRWCENHEPFDESALGWWILAEVHLARNEFEKARWISLQPITFSSQFPKAYLQECFHVAIASWIETNPDQALRLYKSYQKRGYIWPEDTHPDTRLKLASLNIATEEADPIEDEAPLTVEDGKPKKDLNLPLETVRKLTTKNLTNQNP